MDALKNKIQDAVSIYLEDAVRLSRDLAEHPELPYQEYESSRKMLRFWKMLVFR